MRISKSVVDYWLNGLLFFAFYLVMLIAVASEMSLSIFEIEVFYEAFIRTFLILFPIYSINFFLLKYTLKKGKYLVFTILFLPIVILLKYLDTLVTDTLLEEYHIFEINEVEEIEWFLYFSWISIALVINLAYNWFFNQQKLVQSERERLQTELLFLRQQINPHFFFNTLNNLYALSLEESELTPVVILKLSEMMRYVIYECQKPFVKLGQELNHIENYLYLQTIRLNQINEPFEMEINIEDDTVKIAPLILIIFIENAVKHSLEKLGKDANIQLSIISKFSHISMKLSNNKVLSNQIKSKDGGVGLVNVKKRLELVYPKQYKLEITETEEVYSTHLQIPVL